MIIDVAIAGGGPNGLMLACELALAGVRSVVLEQLTEPSREPKANGLVGQVVRLLDHRGLHQRITGRPDAPTPRPGYMFGAFPLDLTGLDPNPLHILPVQQRELEALLAERAEELGVEVRRGHRLNSFEQDAQGVDLQLAGPDGPYQLRARYLVGCDGGRSTVRKLAGIGFPGVSGPTVVHRAAHVTLPAGWVDERTGALEVPGHGRIAPAGYHRTERGVFVFAAVEPGKPLVAVLEWEEAPNAPRSPEPPLTFQELSGAAGRVLGAELPLAAPTSPGPHLLRRLRGGNTRLAEHYRSGRVLLAGDAAHVHSAVGGPGLNLGLQDIANLGWKLAAEVHGWAPPGLLDSYQSERRPVGERVFMHSQAQLALMAPGPAVTALRTLFGELLTDPANTRRIAELLAGSDLRYPVDCAHPLAGRFVPELPLSGPRVAELLRSARPLLLDLSTEGRFAPAAHGWRDRVAVQRADCPGESTAALLIRPDGYVAWAANDQDGDLKPLHEALTSWFGEPLAD